MGALKGKLDPILARVQQVLTVQSPQTGVKLLLTVSSGSSSPTMPSAAAFLALCASNSARVGPANDCLGYTLLQLLDSKVSLHVYVFYHALKPAFMKGQATRKMSMSLRQLHLYSTVVQQCML